MAYRKYNGEISVRCDACLSEDTGPDDTDVWAQRFWTNFSWTINSMSPNTRNYRLDLCGECSEKIRMYIENDMQGGHFEDFPSVGADESAE